MGTRAAPGPEGRPPASSHGGIPGDRWPATVPNSVAVGPREAGARRSLFPSCAMDGGQSSRASHGRQCRRWMGIRPAIRPAAARRALAARGRDRMGGDPPRTPWPEHGCDPSPTAGPSLPPCGSRCQGVRIGGWRRAAMSVGVSPRGGDDLSCPGKGWWRVSMCHRRAPVVSSTGGGVLMGSPRPGSRSQTRGLRRADRVDGPPGRWHGSVRLRNMRATGWMLRRNADRGRRRSWQITDDQGLADFRVRHTRITPDFRAGSGVVFQRSGTGKAGGQRPGHGSHGSIP